MMDKRLMGLSGMKKMMMLLAGISFLQAFMIIFQARYLALSITGLWNGEGLTSQFSQMLFFFFSFWWTTSINLNSRKVAGSFFL